MEVKGTVVRGHQVASGQGDDPRFPGGTLAMQFPYFSELGLDLSEFYPATINVSISPLDFFIVDADYVFTQVKWHEIEPAEDFSFICCQLRVGEEMARGFVYYPHPETKPEHFQPEGLIEVILDRFMPEVSYGAKTVLCFEDGKIGITEEKE